MPTYKVQAAFSVSCYIDREIEADTDKEALAKLKSLHETKELWSNWDINYETADEHRIVDFEGPDPEANYLLVDVQIDSDEWLAIPT